MWYCTSLTLGLCKKIGSNVCGSKLKTEYSREDDNDNNNGSYDNDHDNNGSHLVNACHGPGSIMNLIAYFILKIMKRCVFRKVTCSKLQN